MEPAHLGGPGGRGGVLDTNRRGVGDLWVQLDEAWACIAGCVRVCINPLCCKLQVLVVRTLHAETLMYDAWCFLEETKNGRTIPPATCVRVGSWVRAPGHHEECDTSLFLLVVRRILTNHGNRTD